MHIFDLYRRGVMVVVTVYALVRTVRGLGLLLARMSEPSRQSRMMRGYLAAMLLSVRIRRFCPDGVLLGQRPLSPAPEEVGAIWVFRFFGVVDLGLTHARRQHLLAAVAYAHVFVLDRI